LLWFWFHGTRVITFLCELLFCMHSVHQTPDKKGPKCFVMLNTPQRECGQHSHGVRTGCPLWDPRPCHCEKLQWWDNLHLNALPTTRLGRIILDRPERGGSLGNGLLHSRPLPMGFLNQGPQAFPTLLHGPDSSQHHYPPDHCTNTRRRVCQPQVPLLNQCAPQAALHLVEDSLSDRTHSKCMLRLLLAVSMSIRADNSPRAWS
jgi:hypothetical protein